MQLVKSHRGVVYKLFREGGEPVSVGDTIVDVYGVEAVLEDGVPPHKPDDKGRIYLRGEQGEYGSRPSNFGLVWKKDGG